VPGSGSFVRLGGEKVVDVGRSFCEALRQKYGSSSDQIQVEHFGDTGISVEMVGFQKTEQKQTSVLSYHNMI
jgi:hypothetical protein